MRAEGELRLLAARHVDTEQLLVAADARDVDEGAAIRRPGRAGIGEAVLGEVGHVARLQVDDVDVADAGGKRGERHALPVGRDIRRFGIVHGPHVDALLDVPVQHVLQDQRARFLAAREVREAVAGRRPRHPRHRVPPHPGLDDVLEALVLVEPARQVADDRSVLRRHEDDVHLAVAPVAGGNREDITGRRRFHRIGVGEPRLARIRREVAPVVRRALLVAEGLEPIFQVLVELLVELLRRDAERFHVGVLAAADHRLAQREQVLAQPFLAPPGLDELEHGMAEVVDQARVREFPVAFELGHLRDDVGDRRVAHRHQVDRPPDAGHVVRQALVDPQRHAATDQRGRNDVELEDVRELVDDQPVEEVRRFVHRHHDAIARRFGERADAFLGRARNDILLLELAARLEQDQRHLEGEIVLQLRTDVLVRALGVAGHALEMLLDLGVVVDFEMVGGVDAPPEVVVANLVLPEVRDVGRLRRREGWREEASYHTRGSHLEPAQGAVAHVSSPRRVGVWDALPCRDIHPAVQACAVGTTRADESADTSAILL